MIEGWDIGQEPAISVTTSTKPPTIVVRGQRWLNSTNGTLYEYDGEEWIQLEP